jgi:2,4-diketo-3-deoxy-L-fuconate hydrolase
VVIGKKASYVDEANALEYVAGYAVHNDYSERAFQMERGGQWVKGKSNDTFAPLGPYLVTADEVGDANALDLWLILNGKKIQDSNTSDMIFHIPFLVSYLSQFMTLLPGDVITTGTPAGVGLGMKPQVYLKAGDVVELGIEKLGTQKQEAIAWKPL